jgi:quercetin dioxygenase-like cupin family protein
MHTPQQQLFAREENIPSESVGEGIGRKILGYDDGLMMTHVTFRKGAVGARHQHPHRQISYVEAGSFEVSVGTEMRILKRGDCYVVPPSVDHGVLALEDGAVVDVFSPARLDLLRKDG